MLAGFVSVKSSILSNDAMDGLMRFATQIAVPCLLFSATSTIDLSSAYDWRLLISYYGVAIAGFYAAYKITRRFYQRRPGEAVSVSFGNLFPQLILLGVPIVDRAFGADGLAFAFALISINALICYSIGICTMEGVRADGRSLVSTLAVVVKTLFQNSLMIGILLGFGVNLSGVVLPDAMLDAILMIKSAALPCALFALGGVLTRNSLFGQGSEASVLSLLSLLVKPAIAYGVCTLFGLQGLDRNVVVLLSAMPIGLNAFLFASMYARGVGTVANTVVLSTTLSVLSVSAWLWILIGRA